MEKMERRCGMSKLLVYVPLEHLDQRYTVHLDRDIVNYLDKEKINYWKVNAPEFNSKLPAGHFLNAVDTIKVKSMQICEIASMYSAGLITDKTTFFFSDLWFPGIESLAYLNYFYNVKPKITGIIHAGSFTDTDFVRDMERWAKNFEDIVFDISDKIFVGSKFIKNDIIKKRIIDPRKLFVTPLPLDSSISLFKTKAPKEDTVIFNGRLCDEKQPHLFEEVKKRMSGCGIQFTSTQELNLSKEAYYKLLARSKCVVSFALQENFGYGIAEAAYLGCVPVVPNRLVYPEMYSKEYLYNSIDECVDKISSALDGTLQCPEIVLDSYFHQWFKL